MSLKDQIALGKNIFLQKQCEKTCSGFQRTFKQNRRKHQVVEEECVASLYALLLDAKSHQNTGTTNTSGQSAARPGSRHARAMKSRRPQSAYDVIPADRSQTPVQKRPVSSMSARNYTQSYSFKRDGLNIGQRHKPSMKQANGDQPRKEEEGQVDEKSNNQHVKQIRPYSSKDHYGERRKSQMNQNRPKTAGPLKVHMAESHDAALSHPQLVRPFLPQTRTADKDSSNTASGRQSAMFGARTDTPALHPIKEGEALRSMLGASVARRRSVDEERKRPISRSSSVSSIKHEKGEKLLPRSYPGGAGSGDRETPLPRSNSAMSFPHDDSEDEVMTSDEEEKPHARSSSVATDNSVRKRRSRANSAGLAGSDPPMRRRAGILATPHDHVVGADEQDALHLATLRTQTFLKEYSRKSKLFSYVANARNSSATQNEKQKRSLRSPKITYPELASIKANIKQHEAQTRLLLQKSAKIKNYVHKLARRTRKDSQ